MTGQELVDIQNMSISEFSRHITSIKKDDREFLSNPPKSAFEWLGLMQHYRVPTGLLDWSWSPDIAAYFAVASLEHWREDGVVWFFDERFVDAQLNLHMYNSASRNNTKLDASLMQYTSIRSTYPNPRLEAQRGLFTWYRDITKDYDVFIDDSLAHLVTYAHDEHGMRRKVSAHLLDVYYGKIEIPAELKPEMLKELSRTKDISAKTVYTGMDGLGQSIAEFIQLQVAGEQRPSSPRTIKPADWLIPRPRLITSNDPPSPPS
jgi:FRG domain